MRLLFKENSWFLGSFLLFLLVGIYVLSIPQGQLLLEWNANRMPFEDAFFPIMTKAGEAYGYVAVFFLLLLVQRDRSAFLVPVIGVVVSILSFVSKKIFHQPRPARFFEEQGLFSQVHPIEGVHLNTGLNSFPSGHTMAAFALFAFLAFCWPQKKWAALIFFLIAFLVGLSRMYLVQHFFKDVYLGAILGVSVAVFANQLKSRIPWLQQGTKVINA
jgi:membrane-associated phospholipid phosphatase